MICPKCLRKDSAMINEWQEPSEFWGITQMETHRVVQCWGCGYEFDDYGFDFSEDLDKYKSPKEHGRKFK